MTDEQERQIRERLQWTAYKFGVDALVDQAVDEVISVLASSLRLRRALEAIGESYPDERDKAACDRCEQCGEVVMCSFHSVLSMVDAALADDGGARIGREEEKEKT